MVVVVKVILKKKEYYLIIKMSIYIYDLIAIIFLKYN